MDVEYDLNSIGIKATISKTTNIDSVIKAYEFQKDIFKTGSYDYTINGKVYSTKLVLGKGNYGAVFKVTQGDEIYALKVQQLKTVDEIIDENYGNSPTAANVKAARDFHKGTIDTAFKEAIINFILQENTEDVPKIYDFAFDGNNVFTVLEFVEGKTGHSYVREHMTSQDDRLFLYCPLILSLANMLERLQESLKFTHGDLNLNNFMVSGSKVKLIDFGFSRIELGEPIICMPHFNKNYNKGKDLSTVVFGVISGKNPMIYKSENAKEMYETYSHFLTYHLSQFTDSGRLYKETDKWDNKHAHPKEVIEDLKGCEKAHDENSPASPAKRLRVTGGKSLKHKINMKLTRRNIKIKSSMNKGREISMNKFREEPSHEMKIHEEFDNLSVPKLQAILEQSKIPHIKKYAKVIAELYLGERVEELRLDLFRTLLFFDSSVDGAFELFVKEYKHSGKDEREILIYGTDSKVRNRFKIHWNAIGNWL